MLSPRDFLTTRLTKIQKELFWSCMAKGSAFVLFIAGNAVLARFMGIETFGLWSFYYSLLVLLLSLSALGLDDCARVYAARHRRGGDLRGVLRTSIVLRSTACIALALLLPLTGPSLARLMERPELGRLLQWGALLVLFQGLIQFLKAVFEGLHRIKYCFYLNVLDFGLKLVFSLAIVSFFRTVWGGLSAFTLASFLAASAGFWLLLSRFYAPATGDSQAHLARSMLRYAVPLSINAIGLAVAMEFDTAMLGVLSTNLEVGTYAPAKQLASKLPLFGTLVAVGVLPLFADMDPQRTDALRRLFKKVFLLVAGSFLVLVCLILATAPMLMSLIFGDDFRASTVPLRLLTPFVFCGGVATILGSILDYRRRAVRKGLYLALSTATNIALNVVLIPRWGARGAALATSISYVPYVLLCLVEVMRSLRPGKPSERLRDSDCD